MRVRVSPSAPLVAWSAALGLGVLALSQATGRSPRPLAVLQSLTPHATGILVPVAFAAGWRRTAPAVWLAAVSGATLARLAVWRAPRDGTRDTATGPVCRVAAANLLFTNRTPAAAVDSLLARDPDVVVFAEYTPAHHAGLAGHELAHRLPHVVTAFDRGPRGLAVWSRHPVRTDDHRGPGPTLSVRVAAAGGDLGLVAVHTTTPIQSAPRWRRDLALVGGAAQRAGPRSLTIGDFNAASWHPPFRRLLGDDLVDAHLAHGRPFSASWPAGRRVPRFVRLDHALTGPALVVTGVEDVDVPGSDHRGMVVSVARARRAASGRPDPGGR